MEKEIWRLSPSCDYKYEVSNLARVRPAQGQYKNKILRQYWRFPENINYNIVEIHLEGKKKVRKVHRLVAEVFCDNPNNYPLVMHLDNDIRNNKADNLKWGTLSMNQQQSIREGRGNRPFGSNHANSKLTEADVIEIRSKYIPRKYTLHKIASEYNVSHHLVWRVVKNKNWYHIK